MRAGYLNLLREYDDVVLVDLLLSPIFALENEDCFVTVRERSRYMNVDLMMYPRDEDDFFPSIRNALSE